MFHCFYYFDRFEHEQAYGMQFFLEQKCVENAVAEVRGEATSENTCDDSRYVSTCVSAMADTLIYEE